MPCDKSVFIGIMAECIVMNVFGKLLMEVFASCVLTILIEYLQLISFCANKCPAMESILCKES